MASRVGLEIAINLGHGEKSVLVKHAQLREFVQHKVPHAVVLRALFQDKAQLLDGSIQRGLPHL